MKMEGTIRLKVIDFFILLFCSQIVHSIIKLFIVWNSSRSRQTNKKKKIRRLIFIQTIP